MEASKTPKRWTYEEFARVPCPDGGRVEIIAGELVVTPGAPSPWHQMVVMRLGVILDAFVRSNDLGVILPGPIAVLFAEGDYLNPDLVFVSKDKPGSLTHRGVELPPDLIVEVLSPSTKARDRGIKRERYQLYGVREYWVIDPVHRTLDVWRLEKKALSSERFASGDRYGWQPLPGGPRLTISVETLFEGIP